MNNGVYTVRKLVDEALEAKGWNLTHESLHTREGTIAEHLSIALSFALADFDYQRNQQTSMGIALRIVALLLADIELREEAYQDSKRSYFINLAKKLEKEGHSEEFCSFVREYSHEAD